MSEDIITDPWSRPVSLFSSGTALLFLDTVVRWNSHVLSTGIKWLILIPVLLGLGSTVVSVLRSMTSTFLANQQVSASKVPKIHIQSKYREVLGLIYTSMTGSLAISGVVRAVESEEKSYGILLLIPIFALCTMRIPTSKYGTIVDTYGPIILITMVPMVLSIVWNFYSSTPSNPPPLVPVSIPPNSAQGGMIFLFFAFMLPTTPILQVSTKNHEKTIVNAVLSSAWYVLIFISMANPMKIISWGGIPILVSTCLSSLLELLFSQYHYTWNVSICMSVLLLGTLLSWDNDYTWRTRMAFAMVLGTWRGMVFINGPVYWKKEEQDEVPTKPFGQSPLFQKPMFHGIRVDFSHPGSRFIQSTTLSNKQT